MLVLTRKLNESIKIGDSIEIIVIEVKGEQVKLGVHAPKSIGVHRGEVYDAIQTENQAALESIPQDDLLQTLDAKVNAKKNMNIHKDTGSNS